MARPKKITRTSVSKVNPSAFGPFEKIQNDLQLNQSSFSLILGILIVAVLGILIFNFFNKSQGNVTPESAQVTDQNGDVQKESLPGKYTVKDGDTLFTIAQKYYSDGSQFTEIMKANNLTDENLITTGQVLDIPKLANPTPAASASPSPSSSDQSQPAAGGMGGAENQTIWGEKITSDSYTVAKDDWLSKIAGRAYGDIYAFDKIAKANNISNPNVIEIGTVLKIPR